MALIDRSLELRISDSLGLNPVTAIIGARQVGKSTLAKMIVGRDEKSLYLDMEKPSDRAKLTDAEAFFGLHNDKLICIDEIQLIPNLFSVMRSLVDDAEFKGKFLVLGSASPELLRQSAESLAGRISYFELTPFLLSEIKEHHSLRKYHLRGGFPRAILAPSDEISFDWLANFKMTFLERDLRMFGFNLPPERLHRLWTMLAHLNGQQLNYSQISKSMGFDQKTIRNHIDILSKTFMIRLLKPFHTNTKKRLVKSPKIYIRDTGILHALLRISTYEELYSHPIYGSSWETLVIENILQKHKNWEPYYYRTSSGAELDLVLTKANKKIAFEIKASPAPKVSRGFWSAIDDVAPDYSYIIAQVEEPYPYKNDVWVYPLTKYLNNESD